MDGPVDEGQAKGEAGTGKTEGRPPRRARRPAPDVHRPRAAAPAGTQAGVLGRRLQAIQYVSDLPLSELGFEQLLGETLRRVREVVGADTATILLLAEDQQHLVARASSGLEEELRDTTAIPIGRGVAGRIAATRQAAVVADLSAVEVISPVLRQRIRSLVGAPLIAEGQLVGVIHAGTEKRREFGGDDLQLLRLVADRIAPAIERKREEEAFARLAAIVESSEDAIIGKTLEGTITSWNPAAARLYGYSATEAIGHSIAMIFPPDRLAELEEILARLRRGERIQHYETSRVDRRGHRIDVSVSISPIRDATGRIVGAATIARDITERKRVERQREDLLHTVSHDLRNPLTVIRGHAQLLGRTLAAPGADQRAKHSVEAIATAAKRMNGMIQDLVESARLESGQLRMNRLPLDLPSYVTNLKRRLATVLEPERIQVEETAALPKALADPDRLERILVNLLSNALKHGGPGDVRVSFAARDGEVVTTVADQGPGLAPDELPLLFERFRRGGKTPPEADGLGLGLYIVKMLVEAHGGRVWAESTPGHGARFSFSLPVVVEGGAP